MRTCSKCGFSNDQTMRFCLECGNSLVKEPQMVVPLESIENPENTTEAVTEAFDEETIVANRLPLTTPSGSVSGGTSALKIVIGVVVALFLVGALGVGAIGVGVYLSMGKDNRNRLHGNRVRPGKRPLP